MTGKTGYTAPSNDNQFAPPADMTTIYAHFDSLFWETVDTVTSLPDPTTSQNRVIMAQDTLFVYESNGTSWEIISSPWIAYTPVWTAAGGTTAMGASVLTGVYRYTRGSVEFRVYFKLGTGSSQGTGDWRFSLPVTASASTTRTPVLANIENSTIGFYVGAGFIDPSGTIVSHIAMNSGAGQLAGGTGGPTWQPNSVIALQGSYQY